MVGAKTKEPSFFHTYLPKQILHLHWLLWFERSFLWVSPKKVNKNNYWQFFGEILRATVLKNVKVRALIPSPPTCVTSFMNDPFTVICHMFWRSLFVSAVLRHYPHFHFLWIWQKKKTTLMWRLLSGDFLRINLFFFET